MKLNSVKSGDNIYYYLAKTIRLDNKIKTVNVTKLGSKNELLISHPDDYLEYLNSLVKKANEEEKANSLSYLEEVDFKEQLEQSDSDISKPTYKNIGYLPYLKLYKDLKLDKLFESISKKYRCKFDINQINNFLVMSRIMNPLSKSSTFDNKDIYITNYDFELHDIYRCLDILSKHSDEIVKAIYFNSEKIIDRNTSILYYDCTNYYFETNEEDEDIKIDINDPDSDIQYGMKKYGISKENRPNPIIQMGLFVDADSIPLSYVLNPGNTNEVVTVKPLEEKIGKEMNIKQFVYCSDAGLCSNENKYYNQINGRAYMFTQTLKGLSKVKQEELLKDLNWRYIKDDKPVSLNKFKTIVEKYRNGEELTKEEEKYIEQDMIYKRMPNTIKMKLDPHKEKTINGKEVTRYDYLEFDEDIIVTFSKRYYIYERSVFEKQLYRANEDVENNKIKFNPNDRRRLIKLDQEKDLELDKKTVEYEAKYHGFYALATTLEDDAKTILTETRKRWQIEMMFRILKTNLKARPVYVKTNPHVDGHFLTCFEALTIQRILEVMINKTIINKEDKLTTDKILKTVRNLNVSENKIYYKCLFSNSRYFQKIFKAVDIDITEKNIKLNKIYKLAKL